jgi:uncharacterized membrane protein YdbT with pleckstrin-like domain
MSDPKTTASASTREVPAAAPAVSSTHAPEEGVERPLWTGRTSWKHYIGRLTLWVLGNIAAAVGLGMASGKWPSLSGYRGWIMVGVVAVSALFFLLPMVLHIWGHRYRLTTERLIIERGILSQTIDQTELIRVDDVRLHKSLINRIMGLGSVAIVSTDATDREIVIPGVADPEKVAEVIRNRMRSMRKKSLFVENL